MAKSASHPGFKAVQKEIAGQYGGNMERAGAILASRTRGASAAAKRKNPRLKRVKGSNRGKKSGTTTAYQGDGSFRNY